MEEDKEHDVQIKHIIESANQQPGEESEEVLGVELVRAEIPRRLQVTLLRRPEQIVEAQQHEQLLLDSLEHLQGVAEIPTGERLCHTAAVLDQQAKYSSLPKLADHEPHEFRPRRYGKFCENPNKALESVVGHVILSSVILKIEF